MFCVILVSALPTGYWCLLYLLALGVCSTYWLLVSALPTGSWCQEIMLFRTRDEEPYYALIRPLLYFTLTLQ